MRLRSELATAEDRFSGWAIRAENSVKELTMEYAQYLNVEKRKIIDEAHECSEREVERTSNHARAMSSQESLVVVSALEQQVAGIRVEAATSLDHEQQRLQAQALEMQRCAEGSVQGIRRQLETEASDTIRREVGALQNLEAQARNEAILHVQQVNSEYHQRMSEMRSAVEPSSSPSRSSMPRGMPLQGRAC